MLRSNSLAIRVRWVIAARKGRAQVAQRVGVGPGGSWRPGVRVIAKQFGVDPATVQRISRPFAAASGIMRQMRSGPKQLRALAEELDARQEAKCERREIDLVHDP